MIGLAAPLAHAGESSSANFRLRSAVFASVSSTVVSASALPDFQDSGVSLGPPEAVGFGGSSTTLQTNASGFWPRIAASLSSLDIDGDGRQNFLDGDIDGDGLANAAETDTGFFSGAGDTGSDPLLFDSDGDGFDDGTEVSAGTDPNDDQSSPGTGVPMTPAPLAWWLRGMVSAAALGALVARRSRPQERGKRR